MLNFSVLLSAVHDSVHDFEMKRNYSEPRIFTGGVDISKWKNLSKTEQSNALAKEWYVYFSFRDPKTGKLVRQRNIKAGANRFKTKSERYDHLKSIQYNLLLLLKRGFSPYADNTHLIEKYHPKQSEPVGVTEATNTIVSKTAIQEAFSFGLKIKQKTLSDSSIAGFRSNINKFLKWLTEKKLEKQAISKIDKKLVNEYLNKILESTSPRTRNNARVDLSSLFQVLEDNDIIPENFIKKIAVIKAVPVRHKTYSHKLQEEIYTYMQEHDPMLLLFVKFVSYNFLRPIEVCRLKVKDINLAEKKLSVRAKNSPLKTKIIPERLVKELDVLKMLPPDTSLFSPKGLGLEWNVSDSDKRDYFSKRFKKVKDYFKLDEDYGLYSFRHTFITNLYQQLCKGSTPFEAKSKLMLITGHSSMTALEKYLRDIDAELPKDYSDLLL